MENWLAEQKEEEEAQSWFLAQLKWRRRASNGRSFGGLAKKKGKNSCEHHMHNRNELSLKVIQIWNGILSMSKLGLSVLTIIPLVSQRKLEG